MIKHVRVYIANQEECEKACENSDMNFQPKDIYYFICDNIESVFKKVARKINNNQKEVNVDRVQEGMAFNINGEVVWPNIKYNFYKFLKHHYKNIEEIGIEYIIGIGGGLGAEVKDLCKIVIHSDERKHRGYPHVHVYKSKKEGKGQSVTIGLEKMEVKGKQDVFSKKEMKKIMQILSDNRQELIDTYQKVIKGERVGDFEFKDSTGQYNRIIFKV